MRMALSFKHRVFSCECRLSLSGFDEEYDAVCAREIGARPAEKQNLGRKNSQTMYAPMLLS